MIRLTPPVAVASPLRAVAARTERKLALCGSHSHSLADAPWSDPTWEFWGHASSRAWYSRPMDRYFDLHPRACWGRGGKKTAVYPKWLANNTVPILMQDRYPEVPASVKYPKGRILMEYADARGYFTNHVAWMIALALTEGVTTIGLFGINYGAESEYETQRGSCEYWLGRAAGRGVRIVLPEQCTLLRDPAPLYGYESHDEVTGKLVDAYRRKEYRPEETIRPVLPGQAPPPLAQTPAHLKAEIEAEERDHPRPAWSLSPLPEGTVILTDDGRTHRGEGFSARLVAMDPNRGTVVPDDTLVTWRGTVAPDLPGIVAQEPTRSITGPFNGAAHPTNPGQEALEVK